MNADEVFAHIEEILNRDATITTKKIEVLWGRKITENELRGFLRIGNKTLPFEATYDGAWLSVWIWINATGFRFEFSPEQLDKIVGGENNG